MDTIKHEKLSNRETEVILLVMEGYGDKKIAEELGITLQTVKVYLRRIYSKLGVDNRTHAAFRWLGYT